MQPVARYQPRKSPTERIEAVWHRMSPAGLLPPQAIEIEQSVLGAIMIDRTAAEKALAILGSIENEDESPFYQTRHSYIYMAALACARENVTPDLLTIDNQLRASSRIADVGGTSYLVELTTMVVTTTNIVQHCQILLDKRATRELIRTCEEYKLKAYTGEYDPHDLFNQADQDILDLRGTFATHKGPVTIAKAVAESRETFAKRKANPNGITGVPSKIERLDALLDGFDEGQLIIVGARPGVGKSALAATIALNAAIEGYGTSFDSLEMSKHSIVTRLIANVARVDSRRIKKQTLSGGEIEATARAERRIESLKNFYLSDSSSLTPLEFRTKAIDLTRRHGVRLFIIDYLQLMNPGVRLGTRDLEIGHITRTLKQTALELGVAIILLSQLGRAIEHRQHGRPCLADLRESGNIEQDGDVVLFPWDPNAGNPNDGNPAAGKDIPPAQMQQSWYGREMKIVVAKQRDGQLGDVDVRFIPEYSLFTNP